MVGVTFTASTIIYCQRQKKCSAFSPSVRPLNRYKLEGHGAAVDTGGRVRGQSNRLIDKMLYDSTISVRGHVGRLISGRHTHTRACRYTEADGKVKPRSEVRAPLAAWRRVAHDESSQREPRQVY